MTTVYHEVLIASLPIHQLGQVLVKDPQTLAVQVYDPSVAGAIVQAINEAGLDLAPRVEGKAVIVPVPKCVPIVMYAITCCTHPGDGWHNITAVTCLHATCVHSYVHSPPRASSHQASDTLRVSG
eukprot:SAG31_NODE_4719_length_3010_cov_1.948128_4_plen_125_part_00